MKILIVVGSLHVGGQEKMSVQLANLADKNYNFDFLVYGEQIGEYEMFVKKMNARVIRTNYETLRYLKYYKNLKKIVKEYGPYDVVHCHGMLNIGINMLFFKHLGIQKRIAHGHSANNGRQKQNFITKNYENIMRNLICKKSTHFLACGKAAGDYLYGVDFFSENGMIIPNGIILDDYFFDSNKRKKVRNELKINDDCLVYGIVARLTKLKNHLLLIDIFKEILSNQEDSKLIIVGNGEMFDEISDKIALEGLQNDVLLLGERSDINYILSGLDFFVLPSKYEGFPLSIVEAQVSGLPCFISDGISSEVDISGLVHQFELNKDIVSIANLIISIDRNYQRNEHDIIEKSIYNIEISREKIKKIYRY